MTNQKTEINTATFEENKPTCIDPHNGSTIAIFAVMSKYRMIDPEDHHGSYHVIKFIEENNIQRSAVWYIYKDICNQEPYKFIALIRGRQLGMIHEDLIKKLEKKEEVTFNFAELVEKIRERVPFNTSI